MSPHVLQRPDWYGEPKELGDLFRLTKNGREARASVWSHEFGWEVRLFIGRQLETVRSQVCRSQEEVLLTKDQNIRRHQLEMRAFLASGVRAFVLTAGNLTGEEQAHVFAEALPAMRRLIKRTPGPFIARVTKESSVQLININRWL